MSRVLRQELIAVAVVACETQFPPNDLVQDTYQSICSSVEEKGSILSPSRTTCSASMMKNPGRRSSNFANSSAHNVSVV